MPFRSLNEIPAKPGTYILHLVMDVPRTATIGRLGEFFLLTGSYLYVGSALGPGGLRSRIRHHQKVSSPPRWHIDWLRLYGNIQGVSFMVSQERLECTLVKYIASVHGVRIPIPGFGSSDCQNNCPAHLFYLPQQLTVNKIFKTISTTAPGKDFVIIEY